jgi:hypothetical protein
MAEFVDLCVFKDAKVRVSPMREVRAADRSVYD